MKDTPRTPIRIAPSSGGPPRHLAVLLHGAGSSSASIAHLAQAWRDALPDVAFTAPDAPEPYDLGMGRQWFSVTEESDFNRLGRVAGGLGRLVEFVEAERKRAGVKRGDITLSGFGQGATMAIHLAAAIPGVCATIVTYAGRVADTFSSLPEPVCPWGAARSVSQPQFMLINGELDRVVTPPMARASADQLKTAGYGVTLRFLPGVGHAINPEGQQAGAEFLSARLLPKTTDGLRD
jgi:phospholipase/carboxylesterase